MTTPLSVTQKAALLYENAKRWYDIA